MRVRGAHLGLHSLRALALSWLLRRELLHRATRAPRQPCSSSHCDGPPGVSAWGSISVSPMAMRRWLAQLESGGRTLCRTPRPANHCSVLYGLLDITGCWGRSAASTMPGATGMIMHWASAATGVTFCCQRLRASHPGIHVVRSGGCDILEIIAASWGYGPDASAFAFNEGTAHC